MTGAQDALCVPHHKDTDDAMTEDVGNDVAFVSTQIQGRLEELDAESEQQDAQRMRATELHRYKLFDVMSQAQLVPPPSDAPRTRLKAAPRPRKRISSMTALMKDRYGEPPAPNSQLSICQFFSGKKRKVAEILRRVQSEELTAALGPGEGADNDADDKARLVYSQREWAAILSHIRARFPQLSSHTKLGLQRVHRLVRKQLQQESPPLDESIWRQSSASPAVLTVSDMQWLYDLTQEQAGSLGSGSSGVFSEDVEGTPYVTTLSQVLRRAEVQTSDDEVSNLEEEPVPISVADCLLPAKPQPQALALRGELIRSSALEPEEIVLSPMTPHKRRVEEIVSSPLGEFRTPQRRAPDMVVVLSSLPTAPVTPDAAQRLPQLPAETSLPPSVYSTARAGLTASGSGGTAAADAAADAAAAVLTPRFHSSIVEVAGHIELRESTGGSKVRKLGSRIEPPIDPEDEIADSEEDPDTSISIIEICRKSPSRARSLPDHTSILQVPSSPRHSAPDAPPVFGALSASQLRDTFSEWGLKPTQGRDKMARILTLLSQHLDWQQQLAPPLQFVQQEINRTINRTISANAYWHERVVSYEAVVLAELQQWLQQQGVEVEMDVLERYADQMGVTARQPERERPPRRGPKRR